MTEAISIKNLSVNLNGVEAVKNINLTVYENEFLGIIGPNGGGKSTLIKCMLGLIPKAEGSVKIFGENPLKTKTPIGYVPQFSKINKGFPLTVKEGVLSAFISKSLFKYTSEMKLKALEIIKKLNLESKQDRLVSELSGGELQRFLIARALVNEPKILLLDEPTASIDVSASENVYNILATLTNVTRVIVTHDMLAVSEKIKKIACLNKTLVYHGETSKIENLGEKLYGAKVEFLSHGTPIRVLHSHNSCCDHHHDNDGCLDGGDK